LDLPFVYFVCDKEKKMQEMQVQYEALMLRLERSESRLERSARRFRLCGALALAVVIGCLLLSTRLPAMAQQAGGVSTLENRVAALETQVASLQTQLANIKLTPGPAGPAGPAGADGAAGPAGPAGTPADMSRVAALEAKTQDMSRGPDPNTGKTTVRFSGVNVQVVSGSGATGGAINGLGNLIVGYNELRTQLSDRDDDARTGSHNLIMGQANNYTSYGGLVAGGFNSVSGVFASVSGGEGNTASGPRASVSGGAGNTASGPLASISGGQQNTASGRYASVSGGAFNTASGFTTSVSGGSSNTASNTFSTVSGGSNRSAPGPYDWAAGSLFEDL
jgi:chaperonin cofactor prefoldin